MSVKNGKYQVCQPTQQLAGNKQKHDINGILNNNPNQKVNMFWESGNDSAWLKNNIGKSLMAGETSPP